MYWPSMRPSIPFETMVLWCSFSIQLVLTGAWVSYCIICWTANDWCCLGLRLYHFCFVLLITSMLMDTFVDGCGTFSPQSMSLIWMMVIVSRVWIPEVTLLFICDDIYLYSIVYFLFRSFKDFVFHIGHFQFLRSYSNVQCLLPIFKFFLYF